MRRKWHDTRFVRRRLKRLRFDYFLVWGHGLRFVDEILELLRNEDHIKILKVVPHRPRSIRGFVKQIYSHDYAPFRHLKAKTRYLLKTPAEVRIIFVQNNNCSEVVVGRGRFVHIECSYITGIKERIRDRFNERKNDRRTENHVIHASDNEDHVDHLLKALGEPRGLSLFKPHGRGPIDVPHHLWPFHELCVQQVPLSELRCALLKPTNRGNATRSVVPIEEAPHYQRLCGCPERYGEYRQQFEGTARQTDDYSPEKFMRLSESLHYLEEPHCLSYIVVRRENDGTMVILDGVHRAAILRARGTNTVTEAEVK